MEKEQAPAGSAGQAMPAVPARRRRRWLGTLIALLVIAGLGLLAWHVTHKPKSAYPGGPGGPGGGRRGGAPATTVGVAPATRADIPVYIDALGTVTPSATVTVTPQVSGVLTKVSFEEGQMVKAGQVLATIEPRPFELALMQAQGAQEKDEAQLDAAQVTLRRYQVLLQQDSIARQDVDTQAALVKQLQGTVLGDKAAVGTARLNLEWTRVTAPVAGRIGLRSVDVGNLVSSGSATGVGTITELQPIDIEFAIPQDRIPALQGRIAAGARLAVTAYDRTRTQVLDTGVFLSLNNQSDTQTGTVRAKARFANARLALFPSQFVNVRVLLDTVRGATVVPATALRHGPTGDFVYVLAGDHTVSQRTVVQGLSTADKVQVTQGLAVGEKVITEGGDRLKDGARVVLPGDAPASGARRRGDGASGAGEGWSGRHRRSAEGGASEAEAGGASAAQGAASQAGVGASGASWPASGASGAWGHHRGASGVDRTS
ncbi:MAG: efflux RND transporter periplasmic adaptor subunit [Burkholderiaceae bacterium]